MFVIAYTGDSDGGLLVEEKVDESDVFDTITMSFLETEPGFKERWKPIKVQKVKNPPLEKRFKGRQNEFQNFEI